VSDKKLTLWQVSSRDNIAFVARLMLMFAWLMLIIFILYIAAGGEKPKESPGEIALGMGLITAAYLLIITARRNRLGRLAREGVPVQAELFHTSHYQFFMALGFNYTWHGVSMKKRVQIPYGSATRFMEDRKQAVLIIDRDNPRRFVIGDLYAPDSESTKAL